MSLALLAPLIVACGESDPVMVNVNDAAADLTITVQYLEPDARSSEVGDEITLALGDTVLLSATALNALGLVVGDVSVSWTSSDPGVAEIAADGLLTTVAPGTTEITASAGEVSATVTTTVTDTAD